MPFIGIIGKENDGNFIKNVIKKKYKSTNFEIININQKSIENIKNIKFDAIIINQNVDKLLKCSKYLEKILNNTNFLIINLDTNIKIKIANSSEKSIITFGFNSDAVITISSIKDDNILICIQKKFIGKTKLIEEQEYSIELKKYNINKLYNTLIIFTILQIYEELLQKI